MRVRCTRNDLDAIRDAAVSTRLRRAIKIEGPLDDLTIGAEYAVQAMTQRDGGFWLFLHTVPQSDFPYPYPVEFFQFIDSSPPSHWRLEYGRSGHGPVFKTLSFAEWATDDLFYEKLVDGEEDAVRIYRGHLDAEGGHATDD
jgi:hypothetical protein